MARPKKLTDEQRLANDALSRARWRESNRLVEKLRARNDRARIKGAPEDVAQTPIVEEEVAVQEASYVSFDEVEGYHPPQPAQVSVAPVVTVEQTANEKATYAALERFIAKRAQR